MSGTKLAADSSLANIAAPFSLSRKLRNQVQASMGKIFVTCQRLGVDILPRHFYSSVPDIHKLRTEASWRAPRSMIGVAGINLDDQLAFVRDCCPGYLTDQFVAGNVYARACGENGAEGYGPVESEFLFCFISKKKPKRIIQVGAGVSTSVILQALQKADHQAEIVCIDPYPTNYLKQCADEKKLKLIAEGAQEVSLSVFTQLEGGDLLFVDSTHTVKPGGEVNRIILEILPRLPAGSYIHFHDIYFPYDYQASVLQSVFFWSESVLLHAFLINNNRVSIAVSLSMLHDGRRKELQAFLPGYQPSPMADGVLVLSRGRPVGHFPNATYLLVQN